MLCLLGFFVSLLTYMIMAKRDLAIRADWRFNEGDNLSSIDQEKQEKHFCILAEICKSNIFMGLSDSRIYLKKGKMG